MPYAKLDNKERFRVPRAVREALNLHAGDSVAYTVVDGELRLRKAIDPYAEAGPVARAVEHEFAQHPERFHPLETVMAELGITQADLDMLEPEPGLDDE
jgi:bifunctional DNA-binding transcriptional regulator/antitoxin component of YhaV-PrlF toxin-antitoxin module